MKPFIKTLGYGLGLALACLPLTACVGGSGGYGPEAGWSARSYDGWYDGFYGDIYDGYWGSDNNFYYRQHSRDPYRRGDRSHFQRGDRAPDPRFQRIEGQTREPQPGMHLPRYPKQTRPPPKRHDEKMGHDKPPKDARHNPG